MGCGCTGVHHGWLVLYFGELGIRGGGGCARAHQGMHCMQMMHSRWLGILAGVLAGLGCPGVHLFMQAMDYWLLGISVGCGCTGGHHGWSCIRVGWDCTLVHPGWPVILCGRVGIHACWGCAGVHGIITVRVAWAGTWQGDTVRVA